MDLIEGFGGHRERIGAFLHHCCECGLQLDARAHAYVDDRHTQRRCRSLYLLELEDIGGVVWIPEKGYARDGWNCLLENLQPLGTDVRSKDGVTGDISSRSGEAWHKAGAHGIADRDHDDGNRGGGLLGRQARGRAVGRNDIDRATNERRRGLCEPLRHAVTILIVEGDVAAFEVAEIPQPVPEGVSHGRVVDDADAWDFRRLLPARTPHLDCEQEPDTTDQRSELTPSHVGHGPTSCRGVTTSNRRTLLYAQPSRRATCKSLGQT